MFRKSMEQSPSGEKRASAMIGGRKFRRVWLGAPVLLLFAVCAQADTLAQQSSGQQSNDATQPALPPIVVTDDVGRQITIPQPIRRIVSIAPSATETIFALGAGDRLVGDTDYCDYPAEAKAKPKVGGVMDPNLEEVVALRPDLVVATKEGNRRDTVDALDRLHVPVYGLSARTVDEVLQSTQRLADVIGASEQGKALTASLKARLDEVQHKLANVTPTRVLFVTWTEPLISIGRQTYIADVLRYAGAQSVIESTQDWPHVSMEEVVHLQPEYIVFASDDPSEAATEFAALHDLPGWRDLQAIQDKKIVIVGEAINRPATRLVDVIEQLARELHPDAFAPPAPIGASTAGVAP
jgi:iron complex transport system substrate-binding protein